MKRTTILIILFMICISSGASTEIQNMQTEYTTTPLGIDVACPRFNWQMNDDDFKRGHRQKAYQIIVRDEKRDTVWNTGKIDSDLSLNIPYAGKELKPTTHYTWQLKIWDEAGKSDEQVSWFETGLEVGKPTSSESWNNAKWIGTNEIPVYADYITMFKIGYNIQLGKGSSRASFIYGANDPRLMDKNKNIYNIASEKDKSYLAVELNIAPLAKGDSALINVYRYGYCNNDSTRPIASVKIPTSLVNKSNKYSRHAVGIASNYGKTKIYIDGQQIGYIITNPIGGGGGYIAFPAICDIGYKMDYGQLAAFTNVTVSNYRSPSNSLFNDEPRYLSGGKKGYIKFVSLPSHAMPMLRSSFDINKEKGITKARLYVTARGAYEMYMNGHRIGNDWLNPGLTQYDKQMLYQTYDVMRYVVRGKNGIGAMLGEGWWSGAITFNGDCWNYFGDRQSLLAKLVITYQDGTEDVVTTNPETWQYYVDCPVKYSSIFQGEVYDASKEKFIHDWSTAWYDNTGWRRAAEIPLEGTTPKDMDYSGLQITAQYGPTVKAVESVTAKSMDEVRHGVYVYDLGQNVAGVPSIRLNGLMPGTKVTLRYSEVKYPDMPEYKDNVGMVMLENIRAALAQDIYIARGGEETIQPRFTFHGFRFIEITGIDKPLPTSWVKALSLSSVHSLASDYSTTNEDVNRLWDNITWSTRDNMISIPTDCPQRNERMGWCGDISVFSRTATYVGYLPQFLRRHTTAMRQNQTAEGKFPDIAPISMGFGGMLWGSAGITVPYECFMQYGDKAVLEEHYDAMKHYMEFLNDKCINHQTGIMEQSGIQFNSKHWGDLGDWLGPEQERNDNTLLWDSYYVFDLDIMTHIATVLGKTSDAETFKRLAGERRNFITKTYFDNKSGKTIWSGIQQDMKGKDIDTQTSYVLPIVFHVADDSMTVKLVNNLVATLNRENKTDGIKSITCPPHSLMTGFIGTAWISKALSDNGHSEDAYRLLQNTTYPSWLYPVRNGATTIWERLNSYTQEAGFGGNNGMNSFNHYSFGAVGQWMIANSLGIQRDEQSPGFHHFILKPEVDPTGTITSAHGYYDSMYGRIESSWNISQETKQTNYAFTIPDNTTATLYLQANDIKNVHEKKHSLKHVFDKKAASISNGLLRIELPAGRYEFTVN